MVLSKMKLVWKSNYVYPISRIQNEIGLEVQIHYCRLGQIRITEKTGGFDPGVHLVYVMVLALISPVDFEMSFLSSPST